MHLTAARLCRASVDRLAVITRQTADRPDTQSLPFQLNNFIHVSPLEHIRPSSASRIGPTGHPQRVADFSSGVMRIFVHRR